MIELRDTVAIDVAPEVVWSWLEHLPEHALEWHPDHRASLPVVRAALRASGLPPPALLAYEVWTPLAEYDDGEDISSVLSRKLAAVRCHRSQVAQLRYDRAVRGLNQFRGAAAWGCRYAEVFQHTDPGLLGREGAPATSAAREER